MVVAVKLHLDWIITVTVDFVFNALRSKAINLPFFLSSGWRISG